MVKDMNSSNTVHWNFFFMMLVFFFFLFYFIFKLYIFVLVLPNIKMGNVLSR